MMLMQKTEKQECCVMKKFLAFALAALCAAPMLALTACRSAASDGGAASGASSSSTSVSASSSSSSGAAQVLTVGVDDTYPPMEYQDAGASSDVGFDIDFADAIGQKLGMKVKFVPTQWDGIFMALKAKKFDCIISSVSMTADRVKAYAFTKPYIANAQMIVVKTGDTSIKSQNDLKGKNVGCQTSTTANDSANYLLAHGTKFNLTTYDQIIQCFTALKAGKISAVIVDEVVGEYYIKQSPSEYASASVNLTNEPIGICFRPGDTALRDKVQAAVDSLSSAGTLKSISEKWFGKDLTSNIDTKLKTLG